MVYGLSNDGELAILRQYFKNNDVELGLYFDDGANGGDDLTDSDELAAITTEPSGSNYTREVISPSNVTVSLNADNDALLTIDAETFSVDNSSENIDSFYLYNAVDDDFVGRGKIDTSNRSTDYINLDQVDSLRLAGETMILD